MRIVLNPSPFDALLRDCDLSKTELFLVNEVEGFQMTGRKEPERILKRIWELYPHASIVLTLGEMGAAYDNGQEILWQRAFPVKALDTTAAGDTFTGYFVAAYMEGLEREALREAAAAAAMAVTIPGAAASIPAREDVMDFLGH